MFNHMGFEGKYILIGLVNAMSVQIGTRYSIEWRKYCLRFKLNNWVALLDTHSKHIYAIGCTISTDVSIHPLHYHYLSTTNPKPKPNPSEKLNNLHQAGKWCNALNNKEN